MTITHRKKAKEDRADERCITLKSNERVCILETEDVQLSHR